MRIKITWVDYTIEEIDCCRIGYELPNMIQLIGKLEKRDEAKIVIVQTDIVLMTIPLYSVRKIEEIGNE